MGKQTKQAFYAVRHGKQPGIYSTWPECQKNVIGVHHAIYKKFDTRVEAEAFVAHHDNPTQSKSNNKRPVVSNNVETVHQSRLSHTSSSSLRYSPYQRRSSHDEQKMSTFSSNYNVSVSPAVSHAAPSNSKKTLVVYTDGASSHNGKLYARAGFGVYWGDNDARNASVRIPGKQTNQRAEAMAVNYALEQTQNIKEPLEIMTDSQYVIHAATVWYKNWEKNNWKSSTGKEVQNKDIFQRMRHLIDTRQGQVKFTYVPGHQGVEGNEKADKLAVAGAQKNL